ncbi:MAG: NAD(P)H-dependent oxidoreductase [Gammaproteobacteria bacterium]|nr:NAD(P)H-dependent oxidoreductase [Gammaproteobacteria bacterium]
MKVTCFAASSSSASINKKLVTYAAELIEDAEVEILDLNDYELPLFSVDREAELGQPPLAQAFLDRIIASDALVIAFAEHNGCYSAAYKNICDWASRIQPKVYQDKRMVLLATSPGGRGGSSVLDLASRIGSRRPTPAIAIRAKSTCCRCRFVMVSASAPRDRYSRGYAVVS